MKSKEEGCCKNCAYFIEMEPDNNRLFSERYGCNLHKLYDGEVTLLCRECKALACHIGKTAQITNPPYLNKEAIS